MDKLLIAVADCTGHGVPGAFLSMLGISSMNEIVNRMRRFSANQILEHLRDFVIHIPASDRLQGRSTGRN